MTEERFLHFYRPLLRLYPDAYREAYAQEMLLLAREVFQRAPKNLKRKVAVQIVVDTAWNGVKERVGSFGSSQPIGSNGVYRTAFIGLAVIVPVTALALAVFDVDPGSRTCPVRVSQLTNVPGFIDCVEDL